MSFNGKQSRDKHENPCSPFFLFRENIRNTTPLLGLMTEAGDISRIIAFLRKKKQQQLRALEQLLQVLFNGSKYICLAFWIL